MLETGNFAFDSVTGANVQVLERIEAWGYTSYRVFNPSTGIVYKATEEQLNKDGGTNTYDENYITYKMEGSIKIGIEEDGRIVAGLDACITAFKILYVSTVFVDEEYRRKGYGKYERNP